LAGGITNLQRKKKKREGKAQKGRNGILVQSVSVNTNSGFTPVRTDTIIITMSERE
jgi:hypothetical protein